MVGGQRTPNTLYGRVEVNNYGWWGTICSIGWTDVDAAAVCLELGYTNGHALRPSDLGVTPVSSLGIPIFYLNVQCTGSGPFSTSCCGESASLITYFMGCSHAYDAGVYCLNSSGSPSPPTPPPVPPPPPPPPPPFSPPPPPPPKFT